MTSFFLLCVVLLKIYVIRAVFWSAFRKLDSRRVKIHGTNKWQIKVYNDTACKQHNVYSSFSFIN